MSEGKVAITKKELCISFSPESRQCSKCERWMQPGEFHFTIIEVIDDLIDDSAEPYRQCEQCGRPEEGEA
jgi:hypothetical protein